MIPFDYYLTALVVALIPGTGVIYTVNTGLFYSSKYSVAAAVGCTLGIVPHLIACIFGLSAIMNLSAEVFSYIKIAGALYLGYLAFMTWKHAGEMTFNGDKDQRIKYVGTIRRGILLNVLNPKLTIFFLSFLPQYIPANTNNGIYYMLLLSLIFMLVTLIVFVLYGLLASRVSGLIQKNRQLMKSIERGFACIFAGLAVKLAFQEK